MAESMATVAPANKICWSFYLDFQRGPPPRGVDCLRFEVRIPGISERVVRRSGKVAISFTSATKTDQARAAHSCSSTSLSSPSRAVFHWRLLSTAASALALTAGISTMHSSASAHHSTVEAQQILRKPTGTNLLARKVHLTHMAVRTSIRLVPLRVRELGVQRLPCPAFQSKNKHAWRHIVSIFLQPCAQSIEMHRDD